MASNYDGEPESDTIFRRTPPENLAETRSGESLENNMAAPVNQPDKYDMLMTSIQTQSVQNQKMMQNMAETLKTLQSKICQNNTGKTPRENQTNKRKRTETPNQASTSVSVAVSDDDFDRLVENYSDSESDDSINANDDEREDDPEGQAETEAILSELNDCFGGEEKCSREILPKLASVANAGLRAKISQEKVKETAEKYLRPKNVQNLIPPKVNPEIWGHLRRTTKNQDLRLQKTQALVCKAIIPQMQLLDISLQKQNKKKSLDPTEISKLAMDAMKMMTFVFCDLSYRRRELIIQPGRNEEFRTLCSHDHPVTDNLFGDDLGKSVEDIVKGNKVGSKISGRSKEKYMFRHQKYGNGREDYRDRKFMYNRQTSHQHFRSQPFLGQPHKRKKGQTLHLIDIRNVSVSNDNVKIVFGDLLKTTSPKRHLGEINLPAFHQDKDLCVVSTLLFYLNKTQTIRKNETKLFITTQLPHRGISRDTVSRWTKSVMKAAGVDLTIFKPHSVRAASTSAAHLRHVPMTTILKTAGWTRESTFRKFYNKPVTIDLSYGRNLLEKYTLM